jgi:hypothetical protein
MDRGRLSALDTIRSFLLLGSFSHASCDAILQSRNIEVVGIYSPGESGWGRDGLFFGLVWIIVWLCFVAYSLGRALRSQDPRLRPLRYGLPVFLVLGVAMFAVQCFHASQYSQVCRALLAHVSGR